MVRFLARCLPSICLSRKKRQSLTIAEQKGAGTKHHQEEVNKLFVRRVESIRVTQQGGIAKRLPLSEVEGAHASPSKKTYVDRSNIVLVSSLTEQSSLFFHLENRKQR